MMFFFSYLDCIVTGKFTGLVSCSCIHSQPMPASGWLFAGHVASQLAQAPLHQEGWQDTNQGAMGLFFIEFNFVIPPHDCHSHRIGLPSKQCRLAPFLVTCTACPARLLPQGEVWGGLNIQLIIYFILYNIYILYKCVLYVVDALDFPSRCFSNKLCTAHAGIRSCRF